MIDLQWVSEITLNQQIEFRNPRNQIIVFDGKQIACVLNHNDNAMALISMM